jgi:signal transduction histidine kinase
VKSTEPGPRAGWGAEAIIVCLSWLAAVVAWCAWDLGWSGAVMLAVAGIGALATTWIAWNFVTQTRTTNDESIGRAVMRLREALDPESLASPADRADPMTPDRAERELKDLAEFVGERIVPARTERDNLRAVIDGVADPVLATDPNGRVLVCNRAAREFFQVAAAESARPVVGRSIEELFTQEDVLRLHAAARAGRAGMAQVRVQRPGGARVYQIAASPVLLTTADAERSEETSVGLALRDITELALAMQLKTDFVANASHELRTPLASIRGAVETLRDGAVDDPAMREKFLSMIAANAARLEEMVRDLMELSRVESAEAPLELSRVRIADLCQSVLANFEPPQSEVCRERSLEVRVEIEPGLEEMRTDARLLQLILKNLVDNATKFAFERTAIRIVAERERSERRMANGEQGEVVCFRVIDQGVGIPIEQQARVFERFYQVDPSRTGLRVTKTARRGTGLGLAIVKHAVKRLGGTVRVESVWQQGTTMIVELPQEG